MAIYFKKYNYPDDGFHQNGIWGFGDITSGIIRSEASLTFVLDVLHPQSSHLLDLLPTSLPK